MTQQYFQRVRASLEKSVREWISQWRRRWCLTLFLASSWGRENRLGRSDVTQASPFWLAGWKLVRGGDRKIRHFSDSTSHAPAAYLIGWSGPHRANQNGEYLYPYDDKPARKVKCDSQLLIFFTYTMFSYMPFLDRNTVNEKKEF